MICNYVLSMDYYNIAKLSSLTMSFSADDKQIPAKMSVYATIKYHCI